MAGSGRTADLAATSLAGRSVFAAPRPTPPGPPEPLIGDATLRGEINLAAIDLSAGPAALSGDRSAVLTLSPTIQARADEVLAQADPIEGAIVVMAIDGRLLAVAGRRQAPNRDDVLLALQVWAPAASIFKLVTSAALLEVGVKPDEAVCFHGGMSGIDAANLLESKLDRDCGDLSFGVARSQNAIIAKLASRRLDRVSLADAADRLGFSAAPEFALDVEANRYTLPDDELEFARVAAGFWSSELSPLGGALLAAAIANGGVSVTPRIVSEVRTGAGVQPVLARAGERVLDEEIARSLAEMMAKTTEDGTARSGFHDGSGRRYLGGAKVAGKTGSLSAQKPEFRGYSWFVGFAPAEAPVAVIAVLLANPAKWHLKAHTAARLVLESVL